MQQEHDLVDCLEQPFLWSSSGFRSAHLKLRRVPEGTDGRASAAQDAEIRRKHLMMLVTTIEQLVRGDAIEICRSSARSLD